MFSPTGHRASLASLLVTAASRWRAASFSFLAWTSLPAPCAQQHPSFLPLLPFPSGPKVKPLNRGSLSGFTAHREMEHWPHLQRWKVPKFSAWEELWIPFPTECWLGLLPQTFFSEASLPSPQPLPALSFRKAPPPSHLSARISENILKFSKFMDCLLEPWALQTIEATPSRKYWHHPITTEKGDGHPHSYHAPSRAGKKEWISGYQVTQGREGAKALSIVDQNNFIHTKWSQSSENWRMWTSHGNQF